MFREEVEEDGCMMEKEGRLRRWKHCVREEMVVVGGTEEDVQDRAEWRRLIEEEHLVWDECNFAKICQWPLMVLPPFRL